LASGTLHRKEQGSNRITSGLVFRGGGLHPEWDGLKTSIGIREEWGGLHVRRYFTPQGGGRSGRHSTKISGINGAAEKVSVTTALNRERFL